jgi:hypothetical protein
VPFSVCGTRAPFSHPPFEECPESLALLPGSAALRVWLPSRRRIRLTCLESLSALNARGLPPFRALLLPRDGKTLSSSPSAPALPFQALRPEIGTSAVYPREESRLSSPPAD